MMELKKGGMWEFASWEVHKDLECSESGLHKDGYCHHCYDVKIKKYYRPDGSYWTEQV